MDLDEMEKMCRDAALSSHPHVTPLARALLAVLPVVRAAEAFLPPTDPTRVDHIDRSSKDYACVECAPGNDFVKNHGEWRCPPHELIRAFTTLRAGRGK